jgi:hypothetical protein
MAFDEFFCDVFAHKKVIAIAWWLRVVPITDALAE